MERQAPITCIKAYSVSRRHLMKGACGALCGSAVLGCRAGGTPTLGGLLAGGTLGQERRIRPMGPASKYVPTIEVAFVRRKEDYGMAWPGAIYDGERAFKTYREKIEAAARDLGVKATIRPVPVYSLGEADEWVARAKAAKADGLLVVVLDRQMHAWPTATKAVDSGIPTVVFSPIGTAFTTNTTPLARREGCLICSTDDFRQAAEGMKMIRAGARLREMRYVVLAGKERRETSLKHFGTKLRYVPASDFLDEYNRTPETAEVKSIAADYLKRARKIHGPSGQDVLNGVKSYVVARTLLEREEGDGITMDCLGALGRTKVSLPCIAWSRMNDHGVPAACEADLGACLTHALVQFLFDRPGFEQDPVPDTAAGLLIGAHCSCPTLLNGFGTRPEPFDLSYHHGMRDAVPRTLWKVGQRVTVVDVLPSSKDDDPPQMVISAGAVAGNIDVPPAGGCVVSVSLKLDGVADLLDYPGFHQLFIYGDYKKALRDYCNLFRIKPIVV